MNELGGTIRVVVDLILFLDERRKKSKQRREDGVYDDEPLNLFDWGGSHLETLPATPTGTSTTEELSLPLDDAEATKAEVSEGGTGDNQQVPESNEVDVGDRESSDDREFLQFAKHLFGWAQGRLAKHGGKAGAELEKEVRAARKSLTRLEEADDNDALNESADSNQSGVKSKNRRRRGTLVMPTDLKKLVLKVEDMLVDEIEESAQELSKTVGKSAKVIHRKLDKAILQQKQLKKKQEQVEGSEQVHQNDTVESETETQETSEQEGNTTSMVIGKDVQLTDDSVRKPGKSKGQRKSHRFSIRGGKHGHKSKKSTSKGKTNPKVESEDTPRRRRRSRLKSALGINKSHHVQHSSDNPLFGRDRTGSVFRAQVRSSAASPTPQQKRLLALHTMLQQQETSSSALLPSGLVVPATGEHPEHKTSKGSGNAKFTLSSGEAVLLREASKVATPTGEVDLLSTPESVDDVLTEFQQQDPSGGSRWRRYADMLRSAAYFVTSDEKAAFFANLLDSARGGEDHKDHKPEEEESRREE